jgi:hypothetical protein
VDFLAVLLFFVPLFDAGAACFFVVRFCVDPFALPVVAVAPDDTRVECFWRCRTFVVVAASAAVAAVNAASTATSSILIVFRTIRPPSVAVRYFTPTIFCYGFFSKYRCRRARRDLCVGG